MGNYHIMDRLGAGGMGVVYNAEHLRLRRLVATMTDETDPQHLRRFYVEMRIIAQLHHPNIAREFDAGEVQGEQADSPALHHYVMEFVDGQDLESYIRNQQPLEPTLACELTYQVASALAEAHRLNLVHRDISTVDVRADMYSLGGTLFWCLAGQGPFPHQSSTIRNLVVRLTQAPSRHEGRALFRPGAGRRHGPPANSTRSCCHWSSGSDQS